MRGRPEIGLDTPEMGLRGRREGLNWEAGEAEEVAGHYEGNGWMLERERMEVVNLCFGYAVRGFSRVL